MIKKNKTQYFQITHDTPMVIYGAGALGEKYYQILKNHFNIWCFCDKNAHQIHDKDLPIYTVEEICAKDVKRCSVFFVAIHNGCVHQGVAEQMGKFGFYNILLLPYGYNRNNAEVQRMFDIYHLLSEGTAKLPITQIANSQHLKVANVESDIINQTDRFVTFRIPMEFVFACQQPYTPGADIIHDSKWDRTIPECKDYMNLFEYFTNGNGQIEPYIQRYKAALNHFDEYSIDEFLIDRYGVFQELERGFQMGITSFYHSPIDVAWDEKGIFRILDGHHRATFLCYKGMKWLPVRCEIADYQRYNKRMIRVRESLQKHQLMPEIFRLQTNSVYANEEWFEVFKIIWENLNLSDKNCIFYDLSFSDGYVGRCMYRYGIQTVVGAKNKRESSIIEKENQVLGENKIVIAREDNIVINNQCKNIIYYRITKTDKEKHNIIASTSNNIVLLDICINDSAFGIDAACNYHKIGSYLLCGEIRHVYCNQ